MFQLKNIVVLNISCSQFMFVLGANIFNSASEQPEHLFLGSVRKEHVSEEQCSKDTASKARWRCSGLERTRGIHSACSRFSEALFMLTLQMPLRALQAGPHLRRRGKA